MCARRNHDSTTSHDPVATPRRFAMPFGTLLLSLLVLFGLLSCDRETPPLKTLVDPDSAREISLGQLIGSKTEDGAHVWRGVPFAEPPIGALRWRAPRPAQSWTGTLEALEFGSPCIQFAGPAGEAEGLEETDTRGSEDCLTLNIFAPPSTPDGVPTNDDRLPVMLWIHGGGNTIGDADLYDGSRLALGQEVIVVTIHYRLGVFGWFSHEALAGDDANDEDRSGNFGTLDTIAALEWVKEHISAFGGDPNRVTVFGESAGGSDTIAMLVSPRAAGLFHRAIVQSGSGNTIELSEARNAVDASPAGQSRSSSEILWALLVADEMASDREAARAQAENMTPAEIAGYLRGKSPTEMLSLYDGAFGGMYDTPMLFRDGVVLPRVDARESFASGEYNTVPAIFGTNRDESKLFMAFGSPHVARMGIFPLWYKNERLYNLIAEYGTKMSKTFGVDAPAAAITAGNRAPAYAYRFDWDEEGTMLWFDLSGLLGAAHIMEIPFVFGGLSLGRVTENIFPESSMPAARKLSDQMMSYWGQFADTGVPGRGRSGEQLEWKSWGADPGQFILFDTEADGGLRLSNETLTRDKVLSQIANDDRFESADEKCELYLGLVRYSGQLTQAQYESIEGGICKDS